MTNSSFQVITTVSSYGMVQQVKRNTDRKYN